MNVKSHGAAQAGGCLGTASLAGCTLVRGLSQLASRNKCSQRRAQGLYLSTQWLQSGHRSMTGRASGHITGRCVSPEHVCCKPLMHCCLNALWARHDSACLPVLTTAGRPALAGESAQAANQRCSGRAGSFLRQAPPAPSESGKAASHPPASPQPCRKKAAGEVLMFGPCRA